MKTRLLLSLLLLSLVAQAADPEPAAPVAAAPGNLTDDKTADDLWKRVEESRKEPTDQPTSRPEYLAIVKAWFAGQKAAADAFLTRFPTDPHRYEARMISIQASMQLARIPHADPATAPDPAITRKQLEEIITAPEAPAEVKGEAAFVATINLADDLDNDRPETISTFLKASDDYLTQYGTHKLAPQMRDVQLQVATEATTPESEAVLQKLADGEDARIAEAARASIEKRKKMRELKTKPIELNFTTVDGQPLSLEKLRGKVVLVDFWASWCGPCIAEMPNVVATYQKLHEKGFEIVGISLDQEKPAMEAALKRLNMSWPQYFDGKGWENTIATSFGIKAIPAAWLIDKKGLLRETGLRGEALGSTVEKLLSE